MQAILVLVALGITSFLCATSTARAQAPAMLVKDTNEQRTVYGIEPCQYERIVDVGGTAYFAGAADDGTTGCELWRSDGTAAGTVLVKDIVAGSVSSEPDRFTNLNGTLFFGAGRGLWRSDGTEAGTVEIHGFYPGAPPRRTGHCSSAWRVISGRATAPRLARTS